MNGGYPGGRKRVASSRTPRQVLVGTIITGWVVAVALLLVFGHRLIGASRWAGQTLGLKADAPRPSEITNRAVDEQAVPGHTDRVVKSDKSAGLHFATLHGGLVSADRARPCDLAANPETISDTPLPGASGGISVNDFEHAIRWIDDSNFRYKADVVRAILAQPGEAITGVILERVSMPTAGLRISREAGFFGYLGLRLGDVLVSADETPVSGLEDLVDAFWNVEVGAKLNLRIIRDGKPVNFEYLVE